MFPRLLLITVLFLCSVSVSPAQEPEKSSGPRTDLLTMNGGKPNLSASGEGITAYKTDEIFQLGTTSIRLVKLADARFKIELPIGYTIFNDLIYAVETKAVFTGTCDIVFNLPSAGTKETFAQLRILSPQYDYADPEVPRWNDVTLDSNLDSAEQWPKLAIKERLRDFKSRTLHAVTDDAPLIFIVALRDSAKARDELNADLEISGTGTPQVTEGRTVTYQLKVANRGPDTATAITLHATPGFSFVSVNAGEGKCKMAGENVYCKFPSLEKGRSIDVKIVERCEWNRHFPNAPPGYEQPTSFIRKNITVSSEEQDPSVENNHLDLTTEVYPDQNKGPVIAVVAPTFQQNYPGPAASVPIRFKASDPDGFIKKIELFNRQEGKSLGEPMLRSDGEYELIYKDVGFGRHWVEIVVTDNLGRVASETAPEFFVNGPAKVEIISPKAGSVQNSEERDVTVTIHATSGASPLKKISLDHWQSDATAIGNDTYVVKLKSCARKCDVQAIAIDEKGIETRSERVEFILASPPSASIAWYDGEYVQEFEAGKPVKVNNELILVATGSHNNPGDAEIIKTEIFVDGRLICTDDEPTQLGYGSNCVWRPSPGKYRLQAVATDRDGAVGKSEVIEVVIERP